MTLALVVAAVVAFGEPVADLTVVVAPAVALPKPPNGVTDVPPI
jgi:hypothetical protein